jgi:iron complex transport system substrate-binding protein
LGWNRWKILGVFMKKLIVFFLLSFNCFAYQVTGADNVSIELKESPKKIIAINVTVAEGIIALGEAQKIIGKDLSSSGLTEIKSAKDLGHPYRVSIEGIISLNPDLIIATDDNLDEKTRNQIRTTKIPLLILSASDKGGFEEIKVRIRLIGKVLQKEKQAESIIDKMTVEKNNLETNLKKLSKKQKVFFLYTHGPGKAFIYGKETGINFLIEAAGAINAADFTTGTKALTAEAMVVANPDALLFLKRALDSMGAVDGALKLPGVDLVNAGKNKKIIEISDESRWLGINTFKNAQTLFNKLNGI